MITWDRENDSDNGPKVDDINEKYKNGQLNWQKWQKVLNSPILPGSPFWPAGQLQGAWRRIRAEISSSNSWNQKFRIMFM